MSPLNKKYIICAFILFVMLSTILLNYCSTEDDEILPVLTTTTSISSNTTLQVSTTTNYTSANTIFDILGTDVTGDALVSGVPDLTQISINAVPNGTSGEYILTFILDSTTALCPYGAYIWLIGFSPSSFYEYHFMGFIDNNVYSGYQSIDCSLHYDSETYVTAICSSDSLQATVSIDTNNWPYLSAMPVGTSYCFSIYAISISPSQTWADVIAASQSGSNISYFNYCIP